MNRYFNTEGLCDPGIHYMVRLDDRLRTIRQRFVDRGSYFVINRGRQYGKTTTLRALAEYLRDEYIVVFLDFQEIGTEEFRDENTFSRAFSEIFIKAFRTGNCREGEDAEKCTLLMDGPKKDGESIALRELFVWLSDICAKVSRPVVLIIDEVDSASNNQVFLDFLALLRKYYLDRKNSPTFQSVILAGVYDVKNLKSKLRLDAEHKFNSPWNIAARFNIEMGFSACQIAGMLQEYEADYDYGIDTGAIAEEIYQYTSGYPYLVSAICKLLDDEIVESERFETVQAAWSKEGVAWAVNTLLNEKLPLFESMTRQLWDYSDMKNMLQAILFQGKRVTYNPDSAVIERAEMFGYIINKENSVQVANRIFEMRLYNMFLSEEELHSAIYDVAQGTRNEFLYDGRLNMDRVLERFIVHFNDIYGANDERFIEDHGRKFFLLYLKPIINGTGNYYIEAQTRDARRTDVIVDYLGEQFVVELKIWRGNEYNERGEKQLAAYLEEYHLDKGYMISFNFNKNKKPGVREIMLGNRKLVEAVV